MFVQNDVFNFSLKSSGSIIAYALIQKIPS